MALKEKKLLEKNKYQLSISVDKDKFNEAVNNVYKKQAKKITIPGFRRGKAPRAIIEKMYGKGVFYEDAVNEVLPEAYEDAAKASELKIVGRPEFDIETVDENGVVITAVVYVKPDVEIKNYKCIEAKKTPVVVEDAEVDAEIDRVRERNARISDVEGRAAQNGDIANINYDGYVDGKQFDGGKAEGHDLTLGSGEFIPGFEDQVAGHNVGDEFDVNVSFPEDYHAEELKGKAAVFKVKLNSLKTKELPAADDELATMASEFDTLAEYKADIKAKITERKEQAADREVETQLIDSLVELLEADIPECMFDEEAENLLRDMDNNLRMQGLDLATYLKYTGMDIAAVKAEMRPRAINQVKTRLALEKIAELEKLEATAEDIDEELGKIAKAYGVEIEKVKEMIPTDSVAEDVKVRKAIELVKAEAKLTEEAPAKEKKAPAKKAPAKKTTTAAKSTTTKTAAAKTTAAKKTTAKAEDKAEEKAEPAKKAPAKKPAAKKAPAKKKEEAKTEE